MFHKLHKKLKNSKNWKRKDHQEAIGILEAGRASFTSTNLVSSLNRGGLWQISLTVQKLFLLTEKYFRLKTRDEKQRIINTKQIVKELMNFSYVKEFFNEIVSQADLTASDEVIKSTLFSVLTLYVRVRAFSYAKDIFIFFLVNFSPTTIKMREKKY